ncbi:MAG: ATP-dependent Clp protease adaptor ClpS [Algoriphagus sp.]|jgi:ATP-dependent Clp protease adaptor protein ClpS|uniref:ATP-dependent Clp protease adaptor ClpS n=1 Tax=Algoriphagus sp. TaxID=1872435 RepID=UPI00263A109E|nr:ATP-dependent Clp protease adaptor ClpS [Algoriphagus sp.]MDG1279460.1 ATP-dependent Clp protease adaptor ClpS [Algoriphagus sp.]
MNQMNTTHPMFEEEEVLVEELVDLDAYDLVVYNDDFNTFDHVANILVKVCKHTVEQAEQCTLIIHYKGKCAVKKGGYEELKPLCEAILDAGIQAAIV